MSFTLFPAIDIKDGRCVRLLHGNADQETRYFEDPVDAARQWQDAGTAVLHVVDLDGAFAGSPRNLGIVERIAALGLQVQLGGGLRDTASVRAAFDAGCWRIIAGTRAAREPSWVAEIAALFPGRIVAGIDARDGRVAVSGWTALTGTRTVALARDLAAAGAVAVIHTDIATDGTLEGPNLSAQEDLARQIPVPVIASGGVASIGDIAALLELHRREPGVEGVIVGKALYEGRLDLAEAIALVEQSAR